MCWGLIKIDKNSIAKFIDCFPLNYTQIEIDLEIDRMSSIITLQRKKEGRFFGASCCNWERFVRLI